MQSTIPTKLCGSIYKASIGFEISVSALVDTAGGPKVSLVPGSVDLSFVNTLLLSDLNHVCKIWYWN